MNIYIIFSICHSRIKMKMTVIGWICLLTCLPETAISGQTWRCEGGVYTDLPQASKSCVDAITNEPYVGNTKQNIQHKSYIYEGGYSREKELSPDDPYYQTLESIDMLYFSKSIACNYKISAEIGMRIAENKKIVSEIHKQQLKYGKEWCAAENIKFNVNFSKLSSTNKQMAACNILRKLGKDIVKIKDDERMDMAWQELAKFRPLCISEK